MRLISALLLCLVTGCQATGTISYLMSQAARLEKYLRVANRTADYATNVAYVDYLMEIAPIHKVIASAQCYTAVFHLLQDGSAAIQKASGKSSPEDYAALKETLEKKLAINAPLSRLDEYPYDTVKNMYFDALLVRRVLLDKLSESVHNEDLRRQISIKANHPREFSKETFDSITSDYSAVLGKACDDDDVTIIKATDEYFRNLAVEIEESLGLDGSRNTNYGKALELDAEKMFRNMIVSKIKKGNAKRKYEKDHPIISAISESVKPYLSSLGVAVSARGLLLTAISGARNLYDVCFAFYNAQRLAVKLIETQVADGVVCKGLANLLRDTMPSPPEELMKDRQPGPQV